MLVYIYINMYTSLINQNFKLAVFFANLRTFCRVCQNDVHCCLSSCLVLRSHPPHWQELVVYCEFVMATLLFHSACVPKKQTERATCESQNI